MSTLKEWLSAASLQERKDLASRSGTTLGYLTQVANGHREPSVGLAHKLVLSAAIVRVDSAARADRLPALDFGDLSPVCAACPCYKACKGE